MAVSVFSSTVSTAKENGQFASSPAPSSGPLVASTAVANAIATLVADGATPTQAHVNTLNAAWATFLGPYSNLFAANASLSVDTAQITNINQLKAAIMSLLQQAVGSSLFTAGS